jgi:hypothetical protein
VYVCKQKPPLRASYCTSLSLISRTRQHLVNPTRNDDSSPNGATKLEFLSGSIAQHTLRHLRPVHSSRLSILVMNSQHPVKPDSRLVEEILFDAPLSKLWVTFRRDLCGFTVMGKNHRKSVLKLVEEIDKISIFGTI